MLGGMDPSTSLAICFKLLVFEFFKFLICPVMFPLNQVKSFIVSLSIPQNVQEWSPETCPLLYVLVCFST